MVFEAPELFSIGDFFNALGMTGIFIIYMIPSVVIVLTIYSIYRHFKNKKQKKVEKDSKDKVKTDTNHQINPNNISEENIEEPKDKTKYMNLNLEFDETGRVK